MYKSEKVARTVLPAVSALYFLDGLVGIVTHVQGGVRFELARAVSVNAGAPAVRLAGLSPVMTGAGLVTLKKVARRGRLTLPFSAASTLAA